jgi:hypothetical protein
MRMPVLWVGADQDRGANAFIHGHNLPGRTVDRSDWRDLGIPFVPFGHIAHRSGELVTATAVNHEFLSRMPNPELGTVRELCGRTL